MKDISQLRIGIACHSLRLDGGMGRYSIALVKGLNDLGIKPTVITKKVDHQLADKLQFNLKLINCKLFPTKLRDHYYNYVVKNIVSSHHFDGLISSNRCPSASIGICGGTHISYLQSIKKSPSLFDKFMIKLEKKCYDANSLIIAHSNGMAAEVKNLYHIDTAKIQTIYTPFDTAKFNSTPLNKAEIRSFRESLSIPQNNVVFLLPSAGNHYVKGVDIAVREFNKTQLPITLLIAGRNFPESHNVKYIGFRKDMEQIYKLCDYTLLPSRYEAFGMVAVESVLSGTKVVIAENVYASEVIAPQAKITFNRNTEGALEEALAIAVKTKHECRLQNPLQYVSAHDSEREHVEKILAAAHLI